MSKSGIILIEQSSGWMLCSTSRGGPISRSETLDAHELVSSVLAFAKENGLDTGRVIIAVASSSVLFARLPESVALGVTSNQALRFSLEAVLPVNAEEIVADWIRPKHGKAKGDLSAVAMEVSHLSEIVAALEESECKVNFIVPESILAIEQAIAEKLISVPSISLWVFEQEGGKIELLEMDSQSNLKAWQLLDLERGTVRRSLSLLDSNLLPPFLIGNSDDKGLFEEIHGIDVRSVSATWTSLIQKSSSELIAGRKEPMCDLRLDALASHDPWRRYRRTISIFVSAIVIFVAVLSGTLLWKASKHREVVDLVEKEQRELFLRAFPNQKIPIAIQGRLKSEYAKAIGVRKTDSSASIPISALRILHQAIAAFESDVTFVVEEIRIENNRVLLEFTLDSQQDAGRVASSLARNGFQVEPPATTLGEGDRVLASFTATIDQEKWKKMSMDASSLKERGE